MIMEQKKEIMPEIQLCCPNCKSTFNVDSMYRIYRAYMALTRFSRKTSYKAICSTCGKHSHTRTPPDDDYKCKKCQFQAERDAKRGYKRNPLASKRIQ